MGCPDAGRLYTLATDRWRHFDPALFGGAVAHVTKALKLTLTQGPHFAAPPTPSPRAAEMAAVAEFRAVAVLAKVMLLLLGVVAAAAAASADVVAAAVRAAAAVSVAAAL